MLIKKIESIKNDTKQGSKFLLLIIGIPLLLGICNNYFFGISDYRDTVPTNNIAIETKKEIAEVTPAPVNEIKPPEEVKPPNYQDCMNVQNLKDREFCLNEALKIIN
jgi:hypothetical protein